MYLGPYHPSVTRHLDEGYSTAVLWLTSLSYLLVYTGQDGADEVEHAAMTQSSACLLIGTGLGLRTTMILRCERLLWTVPQADQAALSKACRA